MVRGVSTGSCLAVLIWIIYFCKCWRPVKNRGGFLKIQHDDAFVRRRWFSFNSSLLNWPQEHKGQPFVSTWGPCSFLPPFPDSALVPWVLQMGLTPGNSKIRAHGTCGALSEWPLSQEGQSLASHQPTWLSEPQRGSPSASPATGHGKSSGGVWPRHPVDIPFPLCFLLQPRTYLTAVPLSVSCLLSPVAFRILIFGTPVPSLLLR